MEITIKLSKYDYERYFKKCLNSDTSPEEVLEQFIADLIQSDSSSGSNERRLANAWFNRIYF